MGLIEYVFLFFIGLAVGSFLNVISLRYKENGVFSFKTISGRSHCIKCGKVLKWYELAPIVSFIIQKGKCRSCKNPISFQYPIVELLSGLAFIFVPIYFINHKLLFVPQIFYNNDWSVIALSLIWLFIFTLFLLLSAIDFRLMIIPDGINILLGIAGVVNIILQGYILKLKYPSSFIGYYAQLLSPASNFWNNFWLNHLISVSIGAIFFGAIIILSKERAMGWGDFKLIVALGLIFTWQDIIILIMLSFIIGSFVSIILMIGKEKGMKDFVPFGPFIAIGSVVVFFFGLQLVNTYFNLFNIIY